MYGMYCNIMHNIEFVFFVFFAGVTEKLVDLTNCSLVVQLDLIHHLILMSRIHLFYLEVCVCVGVSVCVCVL